MPQSQHAFDWQRLDTLIRADLVTTRTLLELLQREKAALESRSYDGFDTLLSDKQHAIAQLEQHERERQTLLADTSYRNDAELLAACETDKPILAAQWRELISCWERCQQLNAVNDHIVKRTRLVVGRVLDILQGRSEQVSVYDAGGQTRQSLGGRDISRA